MRVERQNASRKHRHREGGREEGRRDSYLLGVARDVFGAGRGGLQGQAAESLLRDTTLGRTAGLGPDGEGGRTVDELWKGGRKGGREGVSKSQRRRRILLLE